jgi:3-phenylpropionate/trans-cinnamate dioxygenase ferredoxin reductase component
MLPAMLDQIVIVGGGQAGAHAVDTLRRKGFTGSLTLVGAEPYLPYQRPPLSKKYLSGALEQERLLLKAPPFYSEHRVDVRLGRKAVRIERDARQLHLDDGASLGYDALLLATGSTPRQITAPGAHLTGVHYLRTIADVERIRPTLTAGKRLVIVGGGYIGLEVAATAREAGLEVTVLEMADRVMNRVTCCEVSSFYEAEHTRHGVRIVCNARVQAFEGEGSFRAVVCEDGSVYPADLAIVGIGVVPVDELARGAGLECSNGIVVDQHCRTSDPHIFAAGDCTYHPSIHYGRHMRLESVDNAFEQAASAALNMLGTPTPHDKVPWFWSDQYDLKMIIVGLCQGHDAVVMRGSPASRSFSACYLYRGELVAIDTVNSPKDQMAARKLVAARARPDPARLGDPTVPLKDCL